MFATANPKTNNARFLLLVFVLFACSPPIHNRRPIADEVVPASPPTPNLAAVIINGGGEPRINYYSHLEHVRRLLGALEASGVPPDRIAVFSGDGADPAPDLATRDGALPTDFWMLPRSLAARLRPPVEYVNSEIADYALRKASISALRAWFVEAGSTLTASDTLLFYVTDHGEKNRDDLADNSITLWGEELSVSELRELFELLDPGVRVVMLMSQCFSGSFANAIYTESPETESPEARLRANVCGYFSATADRRAHGCYPEISGKEALGHSHRIFDALAALGNLPDAQREVLITDDTPDVPHATTNFYLDKHLQRAASERAIELTALVDELLVEAWAEPLVWEPEIRLLDRIGETFGFASHRLLSDLDRQSEGLAEFGKQITTYRDLWRDTLETLRSQNLRAFRASHPEWAARLQNQALRALEPNELRHLSDELLQDLKRFTEASPPISDRLQALHRKLLTATTAAYRSEVRLAAVLRMRAVLVDIAGRHSITIHASGQENSEFEQLAACEDLTFARLPARNDRGAPEERDPFPTLAAEQQQLEVIVPAWLGMRFRAPTKAARARNELPGGASAVTAIFPDSPAAEAELRVGDIVIGSADADFDQPKEVREWVMQGEIGRPAGLRIVRNGEPLELTIRLARYPLELPELPGPREVGSNAPPLDLQYLPDGPRLAEGRSHLLFFWATWCKPCKRAIPELLAFARARDVEVVAISDEPTETVLAFLDEFSDPFPQVVATDPTRAHYYEYGVSGTPSFVWVDAGGIVRHSSTGYDRNKGLPIDGWSWDHDAN